MSKHMFSKTSMTLDCHGVQAKYRTASCLNSQRVEASGESGEILRFGRSRAAAAWDKPRSGRLAGIGQRAACIQLVNFSRSVQLLIVGMRLRRWAYEMGATLSTHMP